MRRGSGTASQFTGRELAALAVQQAAHLIDRACLEQSAQGGELRVAGAVGDVHVARARPDVQARSACRDLSSRAS